MGALRKMENDEISAVERLSRNRDFMIFREFLKDSLNELREASDFIIDGQVDLIDKGHRQCLREIVSITSKDRIEQLSSNVLSKARHSNPLP